MTISLKKGFFCQTLKMELCRAVCSVRFLLGVAMMLVWILLNAIEAVKTYDHAVFAGVIQLIRLGLDGHASTGPVLLAISSIPYAFSYLTEMESGFQQQVVERVGVSIYGICKLIATFFSAFLMGIVTVWAFIGILSAIGIPHTVRNEEVKDTYAFLAVVWGPAWYYLAKSLLIGLMCGQAALFSLMIMSWIPNAYVGFLSPLIGYYIAECIFSLLSHIASSPFWGLVSPSQLFFGQPMADAGFSYLWTVLVSTALALCFGIRFLLQFGKEHM